MTYYDDREELERGDVAPPDAVTVRHVQPYEARKTYRCPGCNGDIAPGVGHKVVVPVYEPDLRRHWHTGCWAQEARRAGGSAP